MLIPNVDLNQAAADLVEQSQMFQESAHHGDESPEWMLTKITEVRKYLNLAECAILQPKT